MIFYITLGILAIVVGFMVYGSVASQKWHQENIGRETITETEHFYWRLFYFNPDDNRIFVPKQTGGGFTINFANPLSIIAGLLVIVGLATLIVFKEM